MSQSATRCPFITSLPTSKYGRPSLRRILSTLECSFQLPTNRTWGAASRSRSTPCLLSATPSHPTRTSALYDPPLPMATQAHNGSSPKTSSSSPLPSSPALNPPTNAAIAPRASTLFNQSASCSNSPKSPSPPPRSSCTGFSCAIA